MVRFRRFSAWTRVCFPHARGDGPTCVSAAPEEFTFSPRPWGWSEASPSVFDSDGVFPTPVGMVREMFGSSRRIQSFPHARGDGPQLVRIDRRNSGFSPRPWGWSEFVAVADRQRIVFPTPVGMVRTCARRALPDRRFPHARGDGPPVLKSAQLAVEFSPRPWGWSVEPWSWSYRGSVFPTPVGMVR